METNKRTILVPWDFTPVTGYASEHAVKTASITGDDITLLHIVKKGADTSEAETRIKQDAEEIHKKFNIKPNVLVKPGSIFSTIGEVSRDIPTSMVIMGTHGIKGMQKLTGSWALKVIVSSKVPFIVIQEPPVSHVYDKVVFPLDFKKENKEKLRWVGFLSHFFKSKIYIIRPKYTDRAFKRGLNSNIVFAKKYLEGNDIDYDITIADGDGDFGSQTIEFAQKIEADLMLIMTTKSITFTDYILGANEQYIIANSAKIPVMTINPRPSKNLGSFSAYGG